MLEARLRKRLRANDLHTFEEYADLVFAKGSSAEDLVKMVDVVTTNKTDFSVNRLTTITWYNPRYRFL